MLSWVVIQVQSKRLQNAVPQMTMKPQPSSSHDQGMCISHRQSNVQTMPQKEPMHVEQRMSG